jgi:hypothetical protein
MVYGASVLVAFIKTLYIASVLVPEQMGWFISLSLVAALMIYFSNLGVMDAYLIRTRSIQRRETSAGLLRGQLYLVAIVMSSTATVLILIYGYVYIPFQDQALNPTLAAAYLFLQPLQAASLIDLQADRRLGRYSSYMLIKSAAPLIAIATVRSLNSTYIDINFILICEVSTSAALFGITLSSYRHSLTFNPRLKLTMRLAKQGLYFTAQAMLNNLTSNIDKWFVLTSYGFASAGAYSISNQLILVGTTIAGMITTYMIPSMSLSERTRCDVIKRHNTWSVALAASGAILGTTAIYAFWGYITRFYYVYTLSFEIFACAAITMSFIGANFYEAYFRVTNSGKIYFFIQAAANVFLITLLTLVYFLKLDLYWVAISVMLAKAFTWAACRIWATRHSKSK